MEPDARPGELRPVDRKVGAAAPAPRWTAAGSLRLTISPLLAGHLSSLVAEYLTLHPNASVELNTGNRMAGSLRSGCDLGIGVGRPPCSRLVARRIGFLSFLVCASPSYIARHGAPEEPQDLEEHDCLTRASGERWHFLSPAGRYPVPVSGSFSSNDPEVLRVAVLSGHGVAHLPAMSIWDDLSAGRLVRLLPAHPMADREIHAVFPWRPRTLAQVLRFVDFAAERFGSVLAGAEK